MTVAYIDPAERAWARTRRLLFQPVDVEKWLVIGFAAFLAGLAGEWNGAGFTSSWNFDFPPDFGNPFDGPWTGDGHPFGWPGWVLLGLPFGFLCLPLMFALLWLGSRGKFVFLDAMVHSRAAIVEPWKRYGKLGDSLFLWRAGFYLILLIAFGVLFAPVISISRGWSSGLGQSIGAIIGLGAMLGAAVLGVVAAYVALFLDSFVVPLMYRDGIRATEAWRRFMPLFRKNVSEFVIYGLVVLVASVGVALCLIVVGFLTCCILFFMLPLPYVRSVVLLPLSGVFRIYTLEFLEQFGPEYRILPPLDPESPPEPPVDS